MKIKTDTITQARARREAWKRKFALFPVKFADGRWCWLEMVEVRELSNYNNYSFVWSRTIQHRAIGSTEFFPPYPWLAGDRNCISNPDMIVERRRANRDAKSTSTHRSHPEVTFKTPGERD